MMTVKEMAKAKIDEIKDEIDEFEIQGEGDHYRCIELREELELLEEKYIDL